MTARSAAIIFIIILGVSSSMVSLPDVHSQNYATDLFRGYVESDPQYFIGQGWSHGIWTFFVSVTEVLRGGAQPGSSEWVWYDTDTHPGVKAGDFVEVLGHTQMVPCINLTSVPYADCGALVVDPNYSEYVRIGQACPQSLIQISVWTSKSTYNVGDEIILQWNPVPVSGELTLNGPSRTYGPKFLDQSVMQRGQFVVGVAEPNDVGTWTATLVLPGPSGCPPQGQASTTFQVVGTPTLGLQVSISASPQTGNAPLTVSFSSQVTGGTPPYTYMWAFGDGATDTSASPTHVYSQQGQFQAYVEVRDSSGNSATSNWITISVGQSPPQNIFCVSVSSVPSGAAISGGDCYASGATATLTAPDSYQDTSQVFWFWEIDGKSEYGSTNPTLSLKMDRDHNVVAYYIRSDELVVILQDVNEALTRLFDNVDDVKDILTAAKAGQESFKIVVNISPNAARILSKFGKNVPYIEFALDLGTIGSLIANNKMPVQDKLDFLRDFMIERGAELAGIVPCVLALSFTPLTPLGGAAVCTLGASLGVLIAKNKDSIVSKIRSFFTSLKNSLQSFAGWLYKKILQIFGGSSIALLVIDPYGRRVGTTTENGQLVNYQEIPNAYYSGVGSHPQYIAVPDPGEGDFRFIVTGVESGDYHLTASMSVDSSEVSAKELEGNVGQGSTQEHHILVSPEGTATLDPSPFTLLWISQRQFFFVVTIVVALAAGCLVLYAQRNRFAGRGHARVISVRQRRVKPLGVRTRPATTHARVLGVHRRDEERG